MARALPVPRIGFVAAWSGVSHPQPKGCAEGSPNPDTPGLARIVLFKILKNSARNWAVSRSFILKLLNNEKSQSRNPLSRKIFRPAVPKVPRGWRNQDGAADGIATKRRERLLRKYAQLLRLGVAGWITRNSWSS